MAAAARLVLPPARGCAYTCLAARIADRARGLGLRTKPIRHARVAGSRSRYLQIVDALDQCWLIRVSDHRRHWLATGPTPHLDIVSPDGVTGEDAAIVFLEEISLFMRTWAEPVRAPMPKRRRR